MYLFVASFLFLHFSQLFLTPEAGGRKKRDAEKSRVMMMQFLTFCEESVNLCHPRQVASLAEPIVRRTTPSHIFVRQTMCGTLPGSVRVASRKCAGRFPEVCRTWSAEQKCGTEWYRVECMRKPVCATSYIFIVPFFRFLRRAHVTPIMLQHIFIERSRKIMLHHLTSYIFDFHKKKQKYRKSR